VGSTRQIKWTPLGTFTNVRIRASKDNFSTLVLDTIQPQALQRFNQTYDWANLPDALSSNVKVRINDPDHQPTLVIDESPAFTILAGWT